MKNKSAREKHLDELEQISTNSTIQKSILEREQKNELLFELSKLDELDRDIFIRLFS